MRRYRYRNEQGATAVLVAIVSIVLFGAAALAVDYSQLTMERQQLHDNVDSAAHAGAYELPTDGARAATAAVDMAKSQDGSLTPDTALFCVVAVNPATGGVNTAQIPSTCDPGKGPPYDASKYPGLRCNDAICAIPCEASPTSKCNTIRVTEDKTVPFGFARVIGRNSGNTGSVQTAACKGSCGTETPNPLDIVIMADRTASMASADRDAMKKAILKSLETMNPKMHHVAFGALAKSRQTGYTTVSQFNRPEAPRTPSYEDCSRYPRNSWQRSQCNDRNDDKEDAYNAAKSAWESNETAFARSTGWDGSGETDGNGICLTEAVRTNTRSASSTRDEGTWIPIDFTNNYLTTPADGSPGTLVGSSALVDAVSCLPESTSGEYGTNIAGSLKAAVRKAMAGSTLPGASTRPGTIRKVVIFETDGQPDEVGSAAGSTTLDSSELWSGQQSSNSSIRNGTLGCNNFKAVAQNAKANDVLVITIGFGAARTATCEKNFNYSGEPAVKDVLAAAASPAPAGGPSTAGDCVSSTGIADENSDGDFFFCAANGDELSDIFRTAFNQVSNGIRLIRLP